MKPSKVEREPPRVLRFPARVPTPVASFARLIGAIHECDPDRQAEALRQLAELGVHVTFDPAQWGRL